MSSTSKISWPDAQRLSAFTTWFEPLVAKHHLLAESLAPASADASFRRYLRVGVVGGGSLIIMDAPPPQEDVRPFIDIAGRIERAGLNSPRVLAAQVELGFLLMTDLGHQLLLDAIRDDAANVVVDPLAAPRCAPRSDWLMRDAVAALIDWQARVDGTGLPRYDEALLRRELALFPEWCVVREFGVTWTAAQDKTWAALCSQLVASALGQPQVCVHRDWMPRNLMVASPRLGILDFQDAVVGPVTYDIASLLRDAFWSWDESLEIDWAVRWWDAARRSGLLAGHAMENDFGECWRALDWMGLQRHLKVLGIFCRLKHRDGKAAYAADLPRFFAYVNRIAMRYGQLKPLLALIAPLSGVKVETGYTF
jgi:aminoglycoside/choline kinase family phosphotransferase